MDRKFNLDGIDEKIFEEIEIEDTLIERDPIVDEFLSLDYPIIMKKEIDDGEEYWIAEHPDLPGCKTHGDSKQEAIKNLEDAKEAWLDAYSMTGRPIPRPNNGDETENCSGKILLRLPKELHYRLLQRAKKDNTSLNQEILYLISNSLGETDAISNIKKDISKLTTFVHENFKGANLKRSIEELSSNLTFYGKSLKQTNKHADSIQREYGKKNLSSQHYIYKQTTLNEGIANYPTSDLFYGH